MMLCHSDGAVSSRLLGLLILSSLCSAMFQPGISSEEVSGEGHFPGRGAASGVKQRQTSEEFSGDGHFPGRGAASGVKQRQSSEDVSGVGHFPRRGAASGVTQLQNSEEFSGDGHFPMAEKFNMPELNKPPRARNNTPMMYRSIDPDMQPIPTDYCEMLMNAPIPPPIEQIPLSCICSHCKGTMGPKGDIGDRGLPGAPGSPGRRGMMGFIGRPGFTGPQGIKGQKGDMGEKGDPGTVGFTGMKGRMGLKGQKGDQGKDGPPGSQGPQGETGTCPASCESLQGPPGEQGVAGPAGTRGLPGVQGVMGPKGIMGAKGDMGVTGEPGMNGKKGDQGDQGVCECTDGADGSDGVPGEKGHTGDKGDTGAQGVQGPIGLKGQEGIMGLMGIPGPCSPAIQSAFSASINQSFPAPNWPVPFPLVILNLHENFNPHMGIYTAPVNGTYLFTFNLAVAGKPLIVGLFQNFRPIVKVTEATHLSTTSQTVILHLTMGNMVWLQVKDDSSNGIRTGADSSSTFSGTLLYPDSCERPLGRSRRPVSSPTFGPSTFPWGSAILPPTTPTPPP